MKLGKALTLIALGAGTITLGGAGGCGSSDDGSTGGSTAGQTGKTVPKEEGSATSSTDERTFAANKISLGEADRSGNANKDAWKKYGFNLDNQITNITDAKSPGLSSVCKRVSGAGASVHQDGDEGIDNAFGSQVLKLLNPFLPTPSKTVTDAITRGDFTLLLTLKGLSDDAAQTNTGLSGTLLVGGANNTTPPAFDMTTDWPYAQDPQIAISGAYINKGVFVNGTSGTSVKLSLTIQGQQLNLTVNRALISFKHNPSSKSLDDGTIAGVIDTEQLVSGIASVAGNFSPDLCSGQTLEGIKSSIKQASDMLSDGSQDASRECNGISIGIGFTGKQVAKPTKIAVPAPPTANPCTK